MINNFDLGQEYKHVRVKPTLTQTKSDPNDLDYPETRPGCNLVGHWVKILLNQGQVL